MMVDASRGNFGSHTVSLVLRSTILSRSLLDLPGWWLRIFLGQFGVAKALAEANVPDRCLMLGSSAGALAACGMVLGLDFDTIASFVGPGPREQAIYVGIEAVLFWHQVLEVCDLFGQALVERQAAQ